MKTGHRPHVLQGSLWIPPIYSESGAFVEFVEASVVQRGGGKQRQELGGEEGKFDGGEVLQMHKQRPPPE